jgi:DNA (cytosine-5)-methyltransferase 1
MLRVVRESEPRRVFAENVSDEPIKAAADDLYALGYSARYCRLDAAYVGAPHRRPRWWLAAHADGQGEPRQPEHVQMASVSSLPGLDWWAKDLSSTLGVDDDDADRMERLRALGNAQISLVAAWAWRLLGGGHEPDPRGRDF